MRSCGVILSAMKLVYRSLIGIFLLLSSGCIFISSEKVAVVNQGLKYSKSFSAEDSEKIIELLESGKLVVNATSLSGIKPLGHIWPTEEFFIYHRRRQDVSVLEYILTSDGMFVFDRFNKSVRQLEADSGVALLRLFSPWKNEEEEKTASEKPRDQLKFDLFP